ncbi:hypothetical protein NW765_009755 [Fusarium oxysporum]|nr:hypothetical protein NW765_009755 [Fusarium oxysporum]KAJ4275949.1 hypothetical protein NW764_009425 [Fusarium oxysporum]
MDGLKEVDRRLREDHDHPSTNPSCMSRDKSVHDAVGGYTVLHYNTPGNGCLGLTTGVGRNGVVYHLESMGLSSRLQGYSLFTLRSKGELKPKPRQIPEPITPGTISKFTGILNRTESWSSQCPT